MRFVGILYKQYNCPSSKRDEQRSALRRELTDTHSTQIYSVICNLYSVICHLSSFIFHLYSVLCYLLSVICTLYSYFALRRKKYSSKLDIFRSFILYLQNKKVKTKCAIRSNVNSLRTMERILCSLNIV